MRPFTINSTRSERILSLRSLMRMRKERVLSQDGEQFKKVINRGRIQMEAYIFKRHLGSQRIKVETAFKGNGICHLQCPKTLAQSLKHFSSYDRPSIIPRRIRSLKPSQRLIYRHVFCSSLSHFRCYNRTIASFLRLGDPHFFISNAFSQSYFVQYKTYLTMMQCLFLSFQIGFNSF